MLGKPCNSQYEIYPISGYFSKLGAHQTMLADKARLSGFFNALRGAIIPGKSIVLDIGTGTGILVMMAARLGARKVFAIESSPIINIARVIARDNNLHQKIKFIKGYSTEFSITLKKQEDCAPEFWERMGSHPFYAIRMYDHYLGESIEGYITPPILKMLLDRMKF